MSQRSLIRVTRRLARCGLPAVLVAASTLALAQAAIADTTPIAASAALPWADPAHQTPLELLAGRIASHIAGRTVTVDCEGDSGWATLVGGLRGDPDAESGYVATTWDGATGQLIAAASDAVLSSSICLPLNAFAMAAAKPTKCLTPSVAQSTTVRTTASATRRATGRSKAAKRSAETPGPCYLGGGRIAARMAPAYWSRYWSYAVAILTLAHESVHLSGVVGGQLPGGLAVGDQQAEAKADCYGMQWMPYVAEQLGDSPDDAQAIATYFWDKIYPLARTADPAYWSAGCRVGGALDLHVAGDTAWP